MRWHGVLSLVAIAITPLKAVLLDEAFNVDFHHALIGHPQPHTTFFHKPDSSSNAALLYTLSDKAVLGAVNPRDGSVVWRQSIAGQPQDNATEAYLIAGEGDGKITTAIGDQVAAWDAAHGRLAWTYNIESNSKAIDLQAVPVLGSSTDGAVQDVILARQTQNGLGGYVISRLGGDGSGERWLYSDYDTKLDATVALTASPKHVFYITKSAGLISGQKTKVTVLDLTTGKVLKEHSVNLDTDSVSSDGRVVAASGSRNPFMITSEKPFKTLKLNLLGTNKVSTISLEDKGEEIVSVKVHSIPGPAADPHFLVHISSAKKQWAEVYHLNAANGEASRAYSLPATQEVSAFAASSNANKVYFTRVTSTEVSVYSSESHGHLGRWARKQLGTGFQSSSDPILATAEVASREGASIAVRVAVTSPEGSWYMLRNGDTQWSRPEMLAYSDMAAWSDDISADPLAQELETEISVDPATAYVNRVYRHTAELMQLPAFLVQLPQKMLGKTAERTSVRSDLLGSRSLILATKNKHLYSVNSNAGIVQWHTDLSSKIEADSTFRSLSTSEGRVTLYSSNGSLTVVNATSGDVIETKAGSLAVGRIVEVQGSPAATILKISDDGVPQLASDFTPSVPDEGNIVLTLDKAGGVTGWTVGTTIKDVWTFRPGNSKIISIASRPAHDPIASIGRVLGDRSVLYKYFTPNLALLTSVSSKTLTMYLIDAVTGAVLHTSSHPGYLASSPVSAILSENWFAYTFTSQNPESKAVSTQLIVSELYESSVPNDRGHLSAKTNYSSFGPDANAQPHVISAAFTLAEPMSNLAVSQTAQGITIRQLLAYLPSSNAVVAIPRAVLEARRPVDRDPTAAEAEEGLFRYQPQLDLDPKWFISHSRDVMGVKQIPTSPTLLESTSTVFAFGHDIFGTQVAPSQTFDVLGKDFNRIQLVLTVVALYLGVLGIRPLVRQKIVQRGWL